jgi:hypothetical protein
MLRWIVLTHLLSGLMISPFLTHIHIISQTFTVSNLPSGFMSGLIQSCITCVTRTDESLLNGLTLHGTDIRHIFFEPKAYSCRWRSIMQCGMHNQYSGLFTCIMDYLYVLCMILMVLSCVLCMTLMVFIYVYYGLFAYINLVDVMPLFSRFFVLFTDFWQNSLGFWQNSSENHHADFREKPANLSVKSTALWSSRFSLFIHRPQCILIEFSQISSIFSIFLNWRWGPIFSFQRIFTTDPRRSSR